MKKTVMNLQQQHHPEVLVLLNFLLNQLEEAVVRFEIVLNHTHSCAVILILLFQSANDRFLIPQFQQTLNWFDFMYLHGEQKRIKAQAKSYLASGRSTWEGLTLLTYFHCRLFFQAMENLCKDYFQCGAITRPSYYIISFLYSAPLDQTKNVANLIFDSIDAAPFPESNESGFFSSVLALASRYSDLEPKLRFTQKILNDPDKLRWFSQNEDTGMQTVLRCLLEQVDDAGILSSITVGIFAFLDELLSYGELEILDNVFAV